MMSKVNQVTNYFIYLSNKEGQNDLTNKKLQKLLYYSQAWSLALRKKELFRENFEAWIHGPAIPSVYQKFKEFGSSAIALDVTSENFSGLNTQETQLLDEVWRVYGKYDAAYLELLTHSEGPWQRARNGASPYEASNSNISKKDMMEYYEQKTKKIKKRN